MQVKMLPRESLQTGKAGVDFEYTALGMQQQNSHVKQKFATLFNWVCTLVSGGKFNAYLWNSLWAEAANSAILLKNNLSTPKKTLSPFQHFLRKERKHPVFNANNYWNVYHYLQG